jgi:hypothetical protein
MRHPTSFLMLLLVTGCLPASTSRVPPAPVLPIPVDLLAGSAVAVYPLNSFRIDTAMVWARELGDQRATLARIDSMILRTLTLRLTEVTWMSPADLRNAAAKGPGMLVPPEQIGTSRILVKIAAPVPEPVRSQMRQLTAVATGGRFALVPATLVIERADSTRGRVKLVVALIDLRWGAVRWGGTLIGLSENPWDAISQAASQLALKEVPS